LPARLSSEGLLRDYEVPDYRYYPTNRLPNGTRDWAGVRLLQACERLGMQCTLHFVIWRIANVRFRMHMFA